MNQKFLNKKRTSDSHTALENEPKSFKKFIFSYFNSILYRHVRLQTFLDSLV